MPDEYKTFSGSLVLDLRFWWRHVHTLYWSNGIKSFVILNQWRQNDVKSADHCRLLMHWLKTWGLHCVSLVSRKTKSEMVKLLSGKYFEWMNEWIKQYNIIEFGLRRIHVWKICRSERVLSTSSSPRSAEFFISYSTLFNSLLIIANNYILSDSYWNLTWMLCSGMFAGWNLFFVPFLGSYYSVRCNLRW